MDDRNYNLDVVKAISISLVLLLHLRPIWFEGEAAGMSFVAGAGQYAVRLASVYVFKLAVPMFYITSLYIFFNKLAEGKGAEYFFKRVTRLLGLYVFWVTFHCAVYVVATAYDVRYSGGVFDNPAASWMDILVLINMGGPILPFEGGGSVFFFLFNLIILVMVAYAFIRWPAGQRIKVIASVLVIIISVLWFEYSQLVVPLSVRHWKVLNFIVYIPVAYLFVNMQWIYRYRNLYWFLYLGMIVFELAKYFQMGLTSLTYPRGVVVFGSMAVFSTIMRMSFKKDNALVAFLSRHSMGLFALHKYYKFISLAAIIAVAPVFDLASMWAPFRADLLVAATISVVLSVVTVWLLRGTRFGRFIQ